MSGAALVLMPPPFGSALSKAVRMFLVYIIKHDDLNLTTNGVIQGHTEILVYLASAHRHCSGPVLEDALIFLSKILDHNLGFEMAMTLVLRWLSL
jgi:hypothetical protein